MSDKRLLLSTATMCDMTGKRCGLLPPCVAWVARDGRGLLPPCVRLAVGDSVSLLTPCLVKMPRGGCVLSPCVLLLTVDDCGLLPEFVVRLTMDGVVCYLQRMIWTAIEVLSTCVVWMTRNGFDLLSLFPEWMPSAGREGPVTGEAIGPRGRGELSGRAAAGGRHCSAPGRRAAGHQTGEHALSNLQLWRDRLTQQGRTTDTWPTCQWIG